MKEKKLIRTIICCNSALLMAILLILSSHVVFVYASEDKTEVSGKVYEFGKDDHYAFSKSKESVESNSENVYGSFLVEGAIAETTTKEGVTAYNVSEGNLKFFYNYNDTMLLNSNLDTWHLIEDKSKEINGKNLGKEILKGAIILQTSIDRKNWIDVVCMTDAFEKTPVRSKSFYETQDIQLINGCYYRMIVAYELRIRTEKSNVLFINTDKFDYKKRAEVYEFYAYTETEGSNQNTSTETYSLGTKVRVEDFDSYSGKKEITQNDDHYGWDLGSFFVSGYTDEVKDSKGNMVFLKNVGDKVTLWFRLNQDINKLNGKKNLSITADKSGSDQYFETPTMDFGRGTLIIRYTDYNNVKAMPTYYTNYLEANTSIGADTKVQLFEEGDYEIALDYEVTNDQIIDQISHYRIFFKFSIRNGNCMVYPFDIATGSELTNSSMTDHGFRLDLAKSRYLKVNLKREMLTESADGLVEDTRFNGPARDGAEYTDEGIYTITVTNEYTGQFTVKKIYVGTNNVMKAHITTGLSIPEINSLVSQGATIADDGTLQMATLEDTNPNDVTEKQTGAGSPDKETDKKNNSIFLPIIIGVIGIGLIIGIVVYLKRKNVRGEQE